MQTMTEAPVRTEEEEAAALGAALFDNLDPTWADRMDLERLNIFSPRDCACAQFIRGSYSSGRAKLGMSLEDARAHGFTASKQASYPRLKDAWTAEILRRRA